MTFVFVTTVIGLGFPSFGQAETFTVGPGNGFASVTFPDSWNVRQVNRGLEASTKDQEVYIWVEAYTEATLDKLRSEHEEYFTAQGVEVKGPPQIHTITKNGLEMKAMDVPAAWNGKRTVLRYVFFDPGLASDWKLMLSSWASPEGDKQYDAESTSILESVKFFGK
ncbi:MAG: hypothetical protein EXR07_00755 [Acetobacteraceae bacterium]|nr:hypothetical protein [Acetobacteraceae bacterium]